MVQIVFLALNVSEREKKGIVKEVGREDVL
jgi:hypothetical protein